MPEKKKVVLSWSGGKDSALALYELRRSDRYEVVSLLTTVAKEYDRVSHHGVRLDVMAAQAAALGLPWQPLFLTTQSNAPCSPTGDDEVMQAYERLMSETMLAHKAAGVVGVAFGDIFLVPLREYRERKLAQVGMQGVFPLWQRDTTELAERFVALGFQAYLTCVVADKLGEAFAGRPFDTELLRALPPGVDPCGENGEYHSFVFDGPLFTRPVPVRVGEVVRRDVRWFADLLLEEPSPAARTPSGTPH